LKLARLGLAISLSAALFWISTGLGTFWPAAWLAPIPVLMFAAEASRRMAAFAGAAAWFVGSLNLFTYLARVMPAALVAVLLLVPALGFAGAVLAARSATRRLPPLLAPFAFPAAWVTYEFLVSFLSPHGTALSLAYSQTDVLPLLQLASVTGIWGMTFVLLLVPSAIAVAWTKRSFVILAPAAAVLVVVLGFGFFRLQKGPAQGSVRVGLTASDHDIAAAFATTDASLAGEIARAYGERSARLAAQGAQVVILPEKLVGVTPADAEAVLDVFRTAARKGNVTVVAGLNRIGLPALRNVAVVIGPDGHVITEYDKHHMLPGPETGYAPGTRPRMFTAPGGTWGVAICKDMDFPAWSRGYAERGVTILSVPAWDFVRDAHLHSRMAVVRGVENGFSIARAAAQGNLTLSDGYGRVLAEKSSSAEPDVLLVGDLGAGPGATFYTRWGDWFGWVCVLLLVALTFRTARSS
jgi:apolipoprotein N-acyltransferase